VKHVKKPFTTNWYINRMCLPTLVEDRSRRAPDEIVIAFRDAAQNRTPSFREILFLAVDEGLSSLGEMGKQALYRCLENSGIRKNEIPRKVDEFAAFLEKVFGDSAKLLEIQIMKSLYKRVGDIAEFFPEKEDITFTEYVAAAELSTGYE
jgi:hypothetical protein